MQLSSRRRIPGEIEFGIIYGCIAALVLVAARVLPVLHIFPACVFRTITNIPCPTCGSTRAVWELAHGHGKAAISMNPLVALLIGSAMIALAANTVVLLFKLRRPVLLLSSRGVIFSRIAVISVILVNWAYLIIVDR